MSGLERALVNLSTWFMALTGAAYFFMKYLMSGDDPFSVIHHPWQPHALSLHVIAGPAAVFALGLIVRDHILARIVEPRQRRGRATGIVLVALTLPMIASGYLMQVLTDPAIKRVLVGVHAVSGTLYIVLFAGHMVASRLGRNGVRSGTAGRRPGTGEFVPP